MEKKVAYRFLNVKEGQEKAHATFNQMQSKGLNPMMSWGVKWIIVYTDYIEVNENDTREIETSLSN